MQVVKIIPYGHCLACSSLSDFLNFSRSCSVTQLQVGFQFLFLALITEKKVILSKGYRKHLRVFAPVISNKSVLMACQGWKEVGMSFVTNHCM